jgi:hypothetical protein
MAGEVVFLRKWSIMFLAEIFLPLNEVGRFFKHLEPRNALLHLY